MAGVGRERLEVLVGDLKHLLVDDQHVLRTAAHAGLGAFTIRHHAGVLSRFLVLRAARAIADLAGPGLFRGVRRRRTDQKRGGNCRDEKSHVPMIARPRERQEGRKAGRQEFTAGRLEGWKDEGRKDEGRKAGRQEGRK